MTILGGDFVEGSVVYTPSNFAVLFRGRYQSKIPRTIAFFNNAMLRPFANLLF